MKASRRRAAQARPQSELHDKPADFSRICIAIFLVAFAVRLVHVWQIRSAPFFSVLIGDAKGYDEWAQRLAAGDWIGKDVFYQAPLYPYFLGVVYGVAGRSLMAVRIVQAALGSGACVLLALAGRRMFSWRTGLAAGLVLALYAPAIFFDGIIQKSVLDVFFICLSLWILSGLIERAHQTFSWLWLGVALGALSLTRENALVLIAVVAVWAVVRLREPDSQGERVDASRMASSLASFALGLAVVLLPVAVRNYAVGGGFYLTTSQFGPNFYIGNNPGADGTYGPLREGRGTPEYERQDAIELAERAAGHALTPGEVSSYWTGQALRYISAQPGQWLKLMTRKFALLWNSTEAVDSESQESYAEWSWPLKLLGWITHFGTLVPLAVLGAFLAWPAWRRLWLLYALTGAYAASVLLFYVFARYRFPLVPLLVLFAAEALIRWPALLRDTSMTPARRVAAATAMVVAIVGTNWPMLSAASMQAVTETNLGAELQAAGRTDEAIAHYQRALTLAPSGVSTYLNLGTALRAKGRVAEAIDTYRHALSLKPNDGDAHYNLANALMDAGQVNEAITHFAIAAAAAPDSADVQNNFGIALAEGGKPEEAANAFRKALVADPRSATAHRNLADMLSVLGRNDEALDHLRRATEIDPSDATLHYDLARTLLDVRKLADAEAEFRRAIALQPGMAEAHNNLGATLAFEGKTDEAISEFQQAISLNPNAEDAKKNLAAVLAAQRR